MGMKMGNENDGINDINITPFVDIVLVLLIIFMISTPAMVARGMKVALPNAKTSEDVSRVTLKLQLERSGQLLLDGNPIQLSQLKDVYKKIIEANREADAIIAADAMVPHGKVVEVADVLRGLGMGQVALGTQGLATAAKSAPATAPAKKLAE